ncbi:MAG: hypothetical protein ABL866_15280 [Devosia sp.]
MLITHIGSQYATDHLDPHLGQFGWNKDGNQLMIGIHVRYSAHCYSVSQEGPLPEGAFSFADPGGGARVFSPDRHAHSLLVPAMIGGLIAKPTSPVARTHESNWTIFALQMQPALAPGEIFYVFFRLKAAAGHLAAKFAGGVVALELYVESAYARTSKVRTGERKPFGALAAEFKK